MQLADLCRLWGECVMQHAQSPKRIRVTTHALRGSAVDVPCQEGGRELRIHPQDWDMLLAHLVTVPVEDMHAVRRLPVVHDYGMDQH